MAGWIIPKNAKGKDLSPYEADTGVLLPLWAPRGAGITNRHHGYYYARDFLKGTDENRALRFSRIQYVKEVPHQRLHKLFDGTQMISGRAQAFKLALLNCAPYVPRYAIDLSRPTEDILELNARQRAKLMLPNTFTVEKDVEQRNEIGAFLMRYAIGQDFDHVKRDYIDQFIELMNDGDDDAQKAELRTLLGMKLINTALGAAVDPLFADYSRARREQAIPDWAPVCAFSALKNRVRGTEQNYFAELSQRLSVQYQAA